MMKVTGLLVDDADHELTMLLSRLSKSQTVNKDKDY